MQDCMTNLILAILNLANVNRPVLQCSCHIAERASICPVDLQSSAKVHALILRTSKMLLSIG